LANTRDREKDVAPNRGGGFRIQAINTDDEIYTRPTPVAIATKM